MSREHPPAVVIIAAAATAVSVVVFLGGPRLGYLPGIVFSAIVGLLILWRFRPSLSMSWLVAVLLAAYYLGGAVVVGDDVMAHLHLGNDILRYDRGIHVLGALITVLLVAEIARGRKAVSGVIVLAIAAGAGLLVESVELFTALGLPGLFSYDIVDSSLDVVGNTVGLALGFVALVLARRRPLAERAARSVQQARYD